ncbi:hypothetical protein PYW07_004927 [Mythimna separata]|uniref:Uncharacterized protein n=1 Tax=Mythimna separata TaxID=271217 RepID=A0AAD8DN92_MYTSE|nr:hypothetical protein PYW07_004927 [Mythimna separata]
MGGRLCPYPAGDNEHAVVLWYDKTYAKNITVFSRRFNRQDPKYYMHLYVHSLITLDNSLKVDFYFYQFLTNRYRPSFVELHFKLCDMVKYDELFGAELQRSVGDLTCPFPPGEYHLHNLSFQYVPKSFPFVKGRIYCNVSLNVGGVTKLIANGSSDMEIKVARIKNKH